MNKCLFYVLCLELLFLGACSEKSARPLETTNAELAVNWYSGYKMAELLEQEVTATNIDDISSFSEKKWYAKFSAHHSDDPEQVFSISSCKQFLALSQKALNTTRERDNAPFMEMAVMCRATQKIVNARPAKRSYLNSIVFDADLPALLPKQVAMILSTSESDRIEKDQNIKYWSQVNKITAVDASGPNLATYKFDGGEQELELVARGDFNHDGIEDMMITSRDSVSDGTYSAIRLFKLTRLSENGSVSLLE